MDCNQEQALTQMRKSVQNLGSSAEIFSDTTLMRFLIARSMHPEKAAKMFVHWQKWRSDMVPDGFISELEIVDELKAEKIYLQGISRNGGWPVMLIKASKHFPAKDQPQFKKFVVYLLDKSIASSHEGQEIGDEKIIGILDLQGLSYRNVDLHGMITGFKFLQSYYPERLFKLYILRMPWFFVSVWRIVARFLEKATLEKIVIVSNKDEKRQLIEEIGEEVLPEEFGGQAKLILIQDFVLSHTDD